MIHSDFHQPGLCKAWQRNLWWQGVSFFQWTGLSIWKHCFPKQYWPVFSNELSHSQKEARTMIVPARSQCRKSGQYRWNTSTVINKSICLETKVTLSKNTVMLYFALVCSVLNTNRNKYTLASGTNSRGFLFPSPGLAWCCALLSCLLQCYFFIY